jgi:hypothetical protein
MALSLKRSVFRLFHPGNILFQTMLTMLLLWGWLPWICRLNIQCLKTSLHKQRYIIFLSWKEDFYKKPVKYVHIYTFSSMLWSKNILNVYCVKYIMISFNMCVRNYILAFMPLLSVTYIQGWLQCMFQCYECVQSYSLASWIIGNFPSYCMHQEYFLIKRWNLQWKESCHWEHSCGRMAEFSTKV